MKMMSITCYALMFLLVTTKLHWLIEVWLVYIFLTQWLVYVPACITLLPRHPVLFLTF